MTLHDQDHSYQKHLRGRHDQRDHGRRQFGQVGGGSSSSGISTDNTTDIVTRARNESQNRNLSRLSGFPYKAREKLDDIRDDLRTQRQSMIDARKAWRAAQKAGDDEAKIRAEKDFAQAFGNYEGLRGSYNEALQDFQVMNRLKGPERNDRISQLKEKYQVTPLTIQPTQPSTPPSPKPSTPSPSPKPSTPSPSPKPSTPPSWKKLPRLKSNDDIEIRDSSIVTQESVGEAARQRKNEDIRRERERVYNEYLNAVQDLQDPERGQYLPDGTYIPSQRAIRMARDIQRMLDDPNSELMQSPTAFSWDEGENLNRITVRGTHRVIRIPDGLTPFTESEAKGALRSPDLRTISSTEAATVQKMQFVQPKVWPPKKFAKKKDQEEWREALDVLGRFISPVNSKGNLVSLFGDSNTLVISPEQDSGRLGSFSTPGAIYELMSRGEQAYINHIRKTPGLITIREQHSRGVTMLHESIHSIEDRNPKLRNRVHSFFERRTFGFGSVRGGKFPPGENFDGDYRLDTFEYTYQSREYNVTQKPGRNARFGTELLTTVMDGFSAVYRLRKLREELLTAKPAAVMNIERAITEQGPSLNVLRDTETLAFFLDVLSDPSSFD